MSGKRLFTAILLIYLALATAYSVAQPLAEAPDEADHYAFIRYLGLNRSLPQGPTVTQSKHPPLYHGVAAALTAWTGLDFAFLRSNPDALPLGPEKPPNLFVHTTLEAFPWRGGALAMHLARLFSVLLGAVTLWSAWRLGEEVFPDRPQIGLLAAAFLAGLPGFLFISGAINNDNAAGALGSLALLLLARTLRRGLTAGRSAVLGLILGLALLAKVGALALWPLALLAIGGAWSRERPRSLAGLAGHLALAWGLALLIASPWLLRNWRLYGDPLAWPLVRATIDQRLAPLALADLAGLAWGLHRTFWGRFGGAGQIQLPGWAYLATALLSLAILAGAARFVNSFSWSKRPPQGVKTRLPRAIMPDLQDRRLREPAPTEETAAAPWLQIALIGLAPLLSLASLLRYSAWALGADQARLLWPGVAAIAVWVGVGVAGLADWVSHTPAGGQSRRLAAGLAIVMAVFGLAVLVGVIGPAYAPPPPLPADLAPDGPPLARFGAGLALLAVELPAEPLAAGQPVPLRLVWQAAAAMAEDLRPTVRLIHEEGWLAAEWSHAPAAGRYSTDRWPPGLTLTDDYLLAAQPAAPGVYRVVVAVRPFGQDWLPVTPSKTDDPFVSLGQITYR